MIARIIYGYLYNWLATQPLYRKRVYGYLYNWWVTQINGNSIVNHNPRYGYIYNSYAAQATGDNSLASDTDWRVPSNDDWNALITTLGGSSVAGEKMKSTREDPDPHPRWNSGVVATDEVNFAGHGGGYRGATGTSFQYLGIAGYYYSSAGSHIKLDRGLASVAGPITASPGYGFSVRLVRDATVGEISGKSDGDYCDLYAGSDGRLYKTVYIDGLVWLAENLAETKFRDGTDISKVDDDGEWKDTTDPAYCSIYKNDWYTAINVGVFRVPTGANFTTLTDYCIASDPAIDSTNVGNHLKSTRVDPDDHPRWDADATHIPLDTFGFGALPGGHRRDTDGYFLFIGHQIYLLTSTEVVWDTTRGWFIRMSSDHGQLENNLAYIKSGGGSIRLVRDATAAEQLLADGTNLAEYTGNDGKTYITVKIGTQVWTAENLAETKWQDGTDITKVTDGAAWAALDGDPAYCAYDNNEDNAIKYTYISSHPDWGVPTHANITTLTDYLIATYAEITSDNVGNHLKSTRVDPDPHPRWLYNETHIPLDTFGFGGLPGSKRELDGEFVISLGASGYYMTSTGISAPNDHLCYGRRIASSLGNVGLFTPYKVEGYSLRLVRDATAGEISSKSDGDRCDPYIGNDGKRYKTVYINEQVWLAENLAETLWRDGLPIEEVTDNAAWAALASPARCAYNNEEKYAVLHAINYAYIDGLFAIRTS